MQVALYVHPFDLKALDAHGGLARLCDLGIAELSMATSYHDGRWLTPWNPERRVRFLEDGTTHFRPGSDYGRLAPVASSEVSPTGPSPLELVCEQAPAAGLQVRAWTVFGHNTRLGVLHPEASVQNAHGDRYPYALCPSQPDVQRYHASLMSDLAGHQGLGSIELEALGQMGIQHSSHHDKKSFSPSGLLGFALSACFCSACLAVHASLGNDGERAQTQVRAFVDAHTTDADAMEPLAVPASHGGLSDEQRVWVDQVLAARSHTVGQLAELASSACGGLRRAVQVHPDAWFTGSQLSAPAAAAFASGDERVLTCYGEGPAQIAKLLALPGCQSIKESPLRLSIWPKAPQFASDQDLAKIRELCTEHGIASVGIYHLGLLPWRTIERVAKMMTA